MGQEISTIGGGLATVGTSIAAAVTLGQVDAINDAVVECAEYTANHAKETIVNHVAQTVGGGLATVGASVVAAVTLGQVDAINDAVVECAKYTSNHAVETGGKTFNEAVSICEGTPGVGHLIGAGCYVFGNSEHGDLVMKAASRTTGVIAGGIGGFVVGGPVGAVAGGMTAGAAMDGIITGVDSAVHNEFRPHGQIAAWDNVVTAKSSEHVIGGLIGGVLAPVMDGVAGYTAGKSNALRLEKKDCNALQKYLNGEGNMSLDEAFDVGERISKHSTRAKVVHPKNEALENARYGGERIPEGGTSNPDDTLYRGDRAALDGAYRQNAFENGIRPRGTGNDVLDHTRSNRTTNFTSTSTNYNSARFFGVRRRGSDFAIFKLRTTNGVNVNITSKLLGHLSSLYPHQFEVSSYNGIVGSMIEGLLVKEGGNYTWHPNTNFVPPTFSVVGSTPSTYYMTASSIAICGLSRNIN